MEAVLPRSWKQEFAFAAAMREEDILYREKMVRFEANQRIKREDERVREEKRDREAFEMMRTVFATERQVTVFREKLDRYDEKTVEALQENRVQLDAVQKRLDDMLDKAHILPDGRRVFKTEDGTRVFDETGLELNATVIDPNTIGDWHPAWERYKPDLDSKGTLLKEREALHEFQAKSDAAREEIDRDGVTAERLDALDADLKAAMPEAVRRKLGNEGPARDAEAPTPEPSSDARPGATMNDRRQTGFSPM